MSNREFNKEKQKLIKEVENDLQQYYKAYQEYIKEARRNTGNEPPLAFEEWLNGLKEVRELMFWGKELRLELGPVIHLFKWGNATFRIYSNLEALFIFWKHLHRTSTDFLLKGLRR